VFAPLAKLPHFPSVQHTSFLTAMSAFADPDINQAFARLGQVGAEAQRMVERDAALEAELTALGFPSVVSGTSTAPFDYFADFLRGSKGIMLDMFRRKEKLLTAMERVIPILIHGAVATGTYGRGNIILMPMHWGLDGFMSLDQFKTFFWPQLRQVLVGMIEGGVTPLVFWEGDCTSRLETMADIPRGKVIYAFERTDIFRAKEVLGGIACVQGNVPSTLLTTGTPDDITAYCRKLIEQVGKGGGFILDGSAGIPDEARPDNVRAMFRSVYEYGKYQ
jgi:uroporphyrinogen-III decarboxylase